MASMINMDELLRNSEQNRKKDERELKIFSQYQKVFDESCFEWSRDRQYNIMFLRQQERYMNDLLQVRGYLFLNEIYRALGVSETITGQVCGWIFKRENSIGDNYVSFEIWEDPEGNYIVIDFNVDGMILDKVF